MKETRYYDNKNNRIVYIGSKASDDYWDSHWQAEDFEKSIKIKRNPLITKNTKKYLPKGSKILEGGCGRGQNVYLLSKEGYYVEGIDFAEKTINNIRVCMPELNVSFGDVRKLPFDNNSFDGYWSLGVIEHFYEGYDDIMIEMHRVLKPEGILFMTVPTMSPLRQFKAKRGLYANWQANQEEITQFYQFALDPVTIVRKFESNGFKLLEQKPVSGYKGLKDEIIFIKKSLQYIYDSNHLPAKVIRKVIGELTKWFSYHMTFFVFKKVG
jgi:ubiquinone/menaquinone biosynthesis C-methylase UbiE